MDKAVQVEANPEKLGPKSRLNLGKFAKNCFIN